MQYTFSQLAKQLGGKLIGNGDQSFSLQQIFTDSRTPNTENGLFVALVGTRFNGHQFIQPLIEKGVKHFLVSDERFSSSQKANFIIVDDTQKALQQLANQHRQKFQFPIIAITGSNGKTIVKEWLFQLLTKEFSVVKSPKSYNSQIGVPLSLFQIHEYHNLGIFEAGISTVGEMDALQQMIQPTVGIFTNIGSAHNEGFESAQQKLTEKCKLFASVDTLIFQDNDDETSAFIKEQFAEKNCVAWKIEKNQFEVNDFQLQLPQNLTSFQEQNLGHCIATLYTLGLSKEKISKKLKLLKAVPLRLQVVEGKHNAKLINDSYNNDFAGLNIALQFAEQQAKDKELLLVLSQFEQTGLSNEQIAEQLKTVLAKTSVSEVVFVGDYFTKINVGELITVKTSVFKTTKQLIAHLNEIDTSNKTVLIKGARRFQLEQLMPYWSKTNHDTVWEINLSAFANNVAVFRSMLQPNVKLMVMVKAFGYGTSAKEVAQLLQYQHIDYLGVAYAEEGKQLREAGIETPILVLNTSDETFETAVEHNLDIEAYSVEHLQALIYFLRQKKLKDYPIHIKLDTGMHRLGFTQDQLPNLFPLLKSPELKIAGIFSHLAAADDDAEIEFTKMQIERFQQMVKQLQPYCTSQPLLHILNTEGIARQSLPQFDMVRLGIGAYGVLSHAEVGNQLIQVGTLKATISQIKTIQKGETVGYSRKFTATQETKIATITIGYADGYDRRFGNGVGQVLVHQQMVPTVGNICMDMTMIDVSSVENVKVGDQVLITSPELPLTTLAKQIGTIPYELLTNISSRVAREFIYE